MHLCRLLPGPEPVTELMFSNVTESSVVVSWSKPKTACTGFRVTYTNSLTGLVKVVASYNCTELDKSYVLKCSVCILSCQVKAASRQWSGSDLMCFYPSWVQGPLTASPSRPHKEKPRVMPSRPSSPLVHTLTQHSHSRNSIPSPATI